MCKNAINAGKSAIHAFKKLPTMRNAEVSNKAISCYNQRDPDFLVGGGAILILPKKYPFFLKKKLRISQFWWPEMRFYQKMASSPMFITLLIKHRKLERVRLGSKRLG